MKMMQKENQDSIVHIHPLELWRAHQRQHRAGGERPCAREDIGRDPSAETSVGRQQEDVPCPSSSHQSDPKVDKKLKPNGLKCD